MVFCHTKNRENCAQFLPTLSLFYATLLSVIKFDYRNISKNFRHL